MDRNGRLTPLLLALACVGCPSGAKDPLPPEEGTQIASAAPRALGALAGGTDAAPPAMLVPHHSEEVDGVPIPELEVDAGPEPDAAADDELPL
jgi:hypothetical protein